jgi:predicted permease
MSGDFLYEGVETEAGNHWHAAVGRLKPGVNVAQAQAETTAIGPTLKALDPEASADSVWGAVAEPLEAFRVDPTIRRATVLLFVAVLFVLAIACANVAALLLARAAGRERELAIRAALGAGRGRLIRQLLAESLVLSLAGGLAGTLLALWATSFLSRLAPETATTPGGYSYLFRFTAVAVDSRVLLFALAVSIATGLAFGVLPALHASKADPAQGLKDGSPTAGGPGIARVRRMLVPAQVALAAVLLVGAGLLTTSLLRLQGLPTGFNPKNVLAFRFEPPEDARGHRDPALVKRVLDRVSALPGVESSASAFCAPGAGRCMVNVLRHVDAANVLERDRREIGVQAVSPGYFATLEIPILKGRAFTDQDHREGAPRVVLIDETAAKLLWPGQDALGHRIGITNYYFGEGETAEIIGVVPDVRNGRPGEELMPDAYIPLYSYILPSVTVFVRTAVDSGALMPAVSRAIAEEDPGIAIYRVQTMEERLADVVSRQRLAARLLSLLAVVAAFLAAVGLYGLMAESVARRSREIGVRMALGARPAEVRRGVLVSGLAHFAVGLAVGLGSAALLSRLLTALLFETRPLEPSTYLFVALLLLAVSTAASWIPARRATRIDPMAALRSE